MGSMGAVGAVGAAGELVWNLKDLKHPKDLRTHLKDPEHPKAPKDLASVLYLSHCRCQRQSRVPR